MSAQSVLPQQRTGQQKHVSVFVLIDALGWKYVEGRNFLVDVLTYRQPLRTVLGFSSGAIPAMLTGVPPAVNGHWNLCKYEFAIRVAGRANRPAETRICIRVD